MKRATCARCGASRGEDSRALVAVARRAGLPLIAGATDLHRVCQRLVLQAMRSHQAVTP